MTCKCVCCDVSMNWRGGQHQKKWDNLARCWSDKMALVGGLGDLKPSLLQSVIEKVASHE